MINIVKKHVGAPRGALSGALAAVEGPGNEKKLRDAFKKLLLDRCVFREDTTVLPAGRSGGVVYPCCGGPASRPRQLLSRRCGRPSGHEA